MYKYKIIYLKQNGIVSMYLLFKFIILTQLYIIIYVTLTNIIITEIYYGAVYFPTNEFITLYYFHFLRNSVNIAFFN